MRFLEFNIFLIFFLSSSTIILQPQIYNNMTNNESSNPYGRLTPTQLSLQLQQQYQQQQLQYKMYQQQQQQQQQLQQAQLYQHQVQQQNNLLPNNRLLSHVAHHSRSASASPK
jgi:hypothetical protein